MAFNDGTLTDFSNVFDPFEYGDYFPPESFSEVDADGDSVSDFGVVFVDTVFSEPGLFSGFINGKSVSFMTFGSEPGEESSTFFFVAEDDVLSTDDLELTAGNFQSIEVGITGSIDLNGVVLDFTFGSPPTGP